MDLETNLENARTLIDSCGKFPLPKILEVGNITKPRLPYWVWS